MSMLQRCNGMQQQVELKCTSGSQDAVQYVTYKPINTVGPNSVLKTFLCEVCIFSLRLSSSSSFLCLGEFVT